MNDVEAGTVELLLQFIYGCLQQPDLTLPEVVTLFQASDKYALASLHQQCTRLLTAHISFDNIFQLADLAQLHHCSSLLQVHHAAMPAWCSISSAAGVNSLLAVCSNSMHLSCDSCARISHTRYCDCHQSEEEQDLC